MAGKIALFDPAGETGELLSSLGVDCQRIDAGTNLDGYDILVVGKRALNSGAAAPSFERVPGGLKVIVFEQTADALEKRLGFRVQEYGLRQLFPRVVDHPVLSGIGTENLRDWRGASTVLSPELRYELRPRYGPTVLWCGIRVPHIWRCGNHGNVASVLIEKPARGDFLPLLDGGFSLQYSPLLEYREGQGVVLFCQLDVTGRTESDPAAKMLVRNMLSYLSSWKPVVRRTIVYAGEPAGLRHLESAGFKASPFRGKELSPAQVLVAGPGAGKELASGKEAITHWLNAGGNLLVIGPRRRGCECFSARSGRNEEWRTYCCVFRAL